MTHGRLGWGPAGSHREPRLPGSRAAAASCPAGPGRTAVLVLADREQRARVRGELGRLRWRVLEARGGAELLARLEQEPCSAAVMDPWLPDLELDECLAELRLLCPAVDLVTAEGASLSGEPLRSHGRAELLHALRRAADAERPGPRPPGWTPGDPASSEYRPSGVPQRGHGTPGPALTERMRPDGVSPEERQREPEPVRPDLGRPESRLPESRWPESRRPESRRPESRWQESGRPESRWPESGRPVSKKPGSRRPEPLGSESFWRDPVDPDSGGPETGEERCTIGPSHAPAHPRPASAGVSKQAPAAVRDAVADGRPEISAEPSPEASPERSQERIPELIGSSAPMAELRRRILLVARRRTPVLVHGQTGTGKERVARALHRLSGRAGRFVALNCAAIPEPLIESELFGHARGAFTGAAGARAGRIEAAAGGTLFLDEIGELPLAAQAKLLRFLEAGELQRVGEAEPVCVETRLVAATHRRLGAMATAGTFRLDLLHRLAVFLIETPPLAGRVEDLDALIALQLRALAEAAGGMEGPKSVSAEARLRLHAHAWPGNVRELEHTLERAWILSGCAPVIDLSCIDFCSVLD